MAGFLGRTVTMTWGGVNLTGVKTKGLKINGTPVDETAGEDNGWRTLLAAIGDKSVDVSISGVTRSKTLKTDFFAGNVQKPTIFTFPAPYGDILSGTFQLADYSEDMAMNDAVAFSASLQSSGPVTYTP